MIGPLNKKAVIGKLDLPKPAADDDPPALSPLAPSFADLSAPANTTGTMPAAIATQVSQLNYKNIEKHLERDTVIRVAATINNFLQSRSADEQALLKTIVLSKDFAVATIKANDQALSKEISIPTEQLELLNKLLMKLSVYIHLQTGTDIKLWQIKEGASPGLYELKNLMYQARWSHQRKKQLSVTYDLVNEFQAIVAGAQQVLSPFKNQINDYAILSHNRDSVVKTTLALKDNLLKFGHSATVWVLDDSNDDPQKQNARRQQIFGSGDQVDFISEEGSKVTIKYLSQAARQRMIDDYVSRIKNIPEAQELETKFGIDIEDAVNSAIGLNGGAGANRNMAILLNMDKNFAMVDDDVLFKLNAEVAGETLDIDVDLNSCLANGLHQPGSAVVSLNYFGARDSSNLLKASAWLGKSSQEKQKTHPLSTKPVGYKMPFPFKTAAASYFQGHNSKFSNISHGGVLALPAERTKLSTYAPCPIRKEEYLRYEDLTLHSMYHKLISCCAPFAAWNKSKWVYKPAGGIYHDRLFDSPIKDATENMIKETLGVGFFGPILNHILFDGKLSLAKDFDMMSQESKRLEVLRKIAEKLINFDDDAFVEVLKSSFTYDDSCIGRSFFENLRMSLRVLFNADAKKDEGRAESEFAHGAFMALMKYFNIYDRDHLKQLTAKDSEVSVNEKIEMIRPALNIVKKEIRAYGETLLVWPLLMKACNKA